MVTEATTGIIGEQVWESHPSQTATSCLGTQPAQYLFLRLVPELWRAFSSSSLRLTIPLSLPGSH